ncbi:hypothetical protein V2J09_005372 [Rumex salicifolius]
MEKEDEQHFKRLREKRQQKLRGIIALMGLPTTAKTLVAEWIGDWAACPVLCLQHFLSSADDYDSDKKRKEEKEHKAFANLCRVAKFHLLRGVKADSTIVIKSRLNSTYELQRLLELVTSTDTGDYQRYPLLIVECRMTNEFQWREYFERRSKESDGDRINEDEGTRSWYRPASWNEMEDLIATRGPDSYRVEQLLLQPTHDRVPIVVRRLVVDPVYDIIAVTGDSLTDDLGDAIKYLLTTPQQELVDNFPNPHTMVFRELRPYLIEKRLSASESQGRSNYICRLGDCIFKFQETLIHDARDHVCGVCEGQAVPGTPVYTCRACILTLHKACAERIDFKALSFDLGHLDNVSYSNKYIQQKHACKPCIEAGKEFSRRCGSCLSQTHLRCGPLPTILKHNCHRHFLSWTVTKHVYVCNACDSYGGKFAYRCKQCALFYHLKCACLPLELLKHKHGGHEHVMKLMYSHHDDGMEPEESYWCDVCYKDMDPYLWFYSCQGCSYYVAHPHCAGGYKYLSNLKDAKLVQQIQSELERWRELSS